MALYTEPVIAIPVWRDASWEADRATRFGLLCVGDIQRCLRATYAHETPETRQALLDQDLRCAVALGRIAWRYALRAENVNG